MGAAPLPVARREVTWPIEVGTVTLTDWGALDHVARVSVDLVGVGAADGGNVLNGTITCGN